MGLVLMNSDSPRTSSFSRSISLAALTFLSASIFEPIPTMTVFNKVTLHKTGIQPEIITEGRISKAKTHAYYDLFGHSFRLNSDISYNEFGQLNLTLAKSPTIIVNLFSDWVVDCGLQLELV